MHSKGPGSQHRKQISERTSATCATALREKPRKRVQQRVQQCSSLDSSAAATHGALWPHSAGNGWEQHSCSTCSKSSDILMLLLPGFPVLTRGTAHAPSPAQHRPGSPMQGQPGATALTQPDSSCASPSLLPLCPSKAPNAARAAGAAVLGKGLWEAALCRHCRSLAHGQEFRTPRGRSSAAAAVPGPAGSSLSTPVTIWSKQAGARGWAGDV